LNNVLSYSSIWQPVVIPSDVGKATLSFWVYPVNTGPIEDYHGGDLQLALLLDYPYWSMGFSPLRQTLLSLRSNSRTWTHYEYDLTSYAGRKFGCILAHIIMGGQEVGAAQWQCMWMMFLC
jgi:hypothetical protein